jgi:hypothetical protein
MKLPTLLLALAALAGCAHSSGDGSAAAGTTVGSESAPTIEAYAPRRHLGNLGRGGVYDN